MREKIFITFLFYIIISSSFAIVSVSNFFPFGTQYGDTELDRGDDTSSSSIHLSIVFPFFDKKQQNLWVNVNGAVSLAAPISTYTPVCEAVSASYSMIAPFWADIDTRYTGPVSGVFFRQDTTPNVMSKAKNEIVRAFGSKFQSINFNWAFVVTWYNVTAYGANNCKSESQMFRNTLQATLVSNGQNSFAIFYYNNIQWTAGTASGGDCTTGRGGHPAKAGFDAGDGKTFYVIEGSCTEDIININQRSNVNSPGTYVFRIDTSDIEEPGCDVSPGLPTFKSNPSHVNIYGHIPIEFTGPCIESNVSYAKCIFHDPIIKQNVEVMAQIFGKLRSTKIVCYTPFLLGIGRQNVDIIIKYNNGTEQAYNPYIYVVEPSQQSGRYLSVILPKDFKSNNSSSLVFSWNASYIGTASVAIISLFSVSTSNSSHFQRVQIISNVTNNGYYSLLSNKFSMPSYDRSSIYIFSIEPNVLSGISFQNGRTINDQPISLMFTSNPLQYTSWKRDIDIYEMTIRQINPENVENDACTAWVQESPPALDVSGCPSFEHLVISDPNYELDPFSYLYRYNGSIKKEDICYRENSGTVHCCYRENILLPETGCGVAMRYGRDQYIRGILQDGVPYVHCCWRATLNNCNGFYLRRPCGSPQKYIPKAVAAAIGDPHITTFDNIDYTFNGYGEYWFIYDQKVPFGVQARMEPYSVGGVQKSATIFTAFAFHAANASSIQVQKNAAHQGELQVIADGELVDVDNAVLRSMFYKDVHVSIDDNKARASVNYFKHGIGFIIRLKSSTLSFLARIDSKYKEKTSGLLGIFDDNKMNDLSGRNGNITAPDSSLSLIHYNFGETWRVTESESYFIYEGSSYSDFNKPAYVPFLEDMNQVTAPPDVSQICDNNFGCLFDYQITNSKSFATETKNDYDELQKTLKELQNRTITCPFPVFPTNGNWYCASLLPGSVLQYYCASQYYLTGDEALFCKSNGEWAINNFGKTPPNGTPTCTLRTV